MQKHYHCIKVHIWGLLAYILLSNTTRVPQKKKYLELPLCVFREYGKAFWVHFTPTVNASCSKVVHSVHKVALQKAHIWKVHFFHLKFHRWYPLGLKIIIFKSPFSCKNKPLSANTVNYFSINKVKTLYKWLAWFN